MEVQTAAVGNHPFAEDIRLAGEVLSKDRKATALFVERYSGPIYTFVRHRVAYRPEAVEDLVQEVFLAAWRSLVRFKGDASLQTWLLSIARHKVDDYHRRRAREAPWPEDTELVSETPGGGVLSALERADTRDKLHAALGTLPEHYSLVLTLRYLEEQTLRQIAELTGKTEKAVERTLARARDQFRARWNDAER